MKKKLLLIAATLSISNAFADEASFESDDCKNQVLAIAHGLVNTFKDQKLGKISVNSTTKHRNYSINITDLDGDPAHLDYSASLSNDSESKCLVLSVNLIQTGG